MSPPLPLRRRLRDAFAAVMAEPAMDRRLRDLGYIPRGTTPEEHQRQTEAFVALWIEVGRHVNLNQ